MDRVPQPASSAPANSARSASPTLFLQLLGLSIFFEVLAILGIVVRPLNVLRLTGEFPWLAALISASLYVLVGLSVRDDGRVQLRHIQVPGAMLLLAYCAGSFEQLTVVLLPHTLLGSALDRAMQQATPNRVAILVSALLVALVLAQMERRQDQRAGDVCSSALGWATIVGAILCIAIPLPSAPFSSMALNGFGPTATAAATSAARLGVICFPLLWAAIATFAALGKPSARSDKSWAKRSLLLAALIVIVTLSARSEPSPLVAIPLSLALAALVHLLSRLALHSDSVPAVHRTQITRTDIAIILVFFLSGFAALVYQVVFAKGLALTFGSTSHASTIVLATYMAGLALGSFWGGKLAERVTRPVLFYAGAELGVAVICAAAPLTLKFTRALYVMIAAGADPAASWLVGLQLALGAAVLIPPTLLMGLTLPMLTRHLIARRAGLGASAGVLYSSNTLGAAVGAIATGYLIMPALGVLSSLRLAVVINVGVAVTALLIAHSQTKRNVHVDPLPDIAIPGTEPAREQRPVDRVLGWVAIIQLTVGGFITFGLETTFIHLLATIAGNSVYAFSLMLFAFLIGLGAGSNAARRWLSVQRELAVALLLCQALVALSLLLGVPFWDSIPRYFAAFGFWLPARSFAARELIRFLACLVIMLPPAVFIGAQFPIAMEAVGRAFPAKKIAALGVASALNTVGNILGALVVGFGLLPVLGSLSTLHALTVGCIMLAALSLPYAGRRGQLATGVLLGLEAILFLKQPAQFNLSVLASGGNVYFASQQYGRVIDSAESLDGGMTTVAVTGERSSRPILTLLTNGKFQGDDSTGGEMKAQSSFALAPLLHTSARQSALVIGFGTGTTTKVFRQAGFGQIDVAELSGDILTLADRHFRAVNAGVLHEPQVKAHVTDGRNFLLLGRSKYDVISIELSSIWFAGAANLYNREFYQLVRQRLASGGVFQQWVQLHRLSELDIATIMTTLIEQFPHVWLYYLGKQGILVACEGDCEPSAQNLKALENARMLAGTLRLFGGHAEEVLKGQLLTPSSLRQLVSDANRRFSSVKNSLVATDDQLMLEYSTPKGNVRPYMESLDQNLRYLEQFKAPNAQSPIR